ncbi:hypothetical protein R1flu_019632 [Riccia fluitans]|uniref:Uncharacterized protein n=1 Tax=Riccia fluitans TaxID=41844 RepID=A0ABD1ZMP9_9MARC
MQVRSHPALNKERLATESTNRSCVSHSSRIMARALGLRKGGPGHYAFPQTRGAAAAPARHFYTRFLLSEFHRGNSRPRSAHRIAPSSRNSQISNRQGAAKSDGSRVRGLGIPCSTHDSAANTLFVLGFARAHTNQRRRWSLERPHSSGLAQKGIAGIGSLWRMRLPTRKQGFACLLPNWWGKQIRVAAQRSCRFKVTMIPCGGGVDSRASSHAFAWLGVVPFHVTDPRPALSSFHRVSPHSVFAPVDPCQARELSATFSFSKWRGGIPRYAGFGSKL